MASGHKGKVQVHTPQWSSGESLMERRVESAKATCDHFGHNIYFLNVMRRMSIDCDCAGKRAKEPNNSRCGHPSFHESSCHRPSLYRPYIEQNKNLVERIESRYGPRKLSYIRELGMDSSEDALIDIHAA